MEKVSLYWKAIIAAVSPVFLLVQSALTDDNINQQEWVGILVAAVVAFGVLKKANTIDGQNVATTPAHAEVGGPTH